jgi:hypothetical protein
MIQRPFLFSARPSTKSVIRERRASHYIKPLLRFPIARKEWLARNGHIPRLTADVSIRLEQISLYLH